MLNRRVLRIKVFQALYSAQCDESVNHPTQEKNLIKSLTNLNNSLLSVLVFPLAIKHFLENVLNPEQRQFNPNPETLKKHSFFTKNKALAELEEQSDVASYWSKPHIDWISDLDFIQLIFKKFIHSVAYEKLIEDNADVADEDRDFNYLFGFYRYLLNKSKEFSSQMEEYNLHWINEKYTIFKTIKETIIKENRPLNQMEVPTMSNDWQEDKEFAIELYQQCHIKSDEFEKLIVAKTPKWDAERIAKTDILLMKMAICEFLYFPYIPVKVSLNEYLELAKKYSTPNSSKFLNGILDNLLKDLQKENKIQKKGRGLIG